jgi:putative oxygen-independent coproporphyrinogen III oxidase
MAGIYIHIPFCKQACYYCDFHFSTNQAKRVELIKCVASELEYQKNYLSGEPIETIYLGGGTPSLLSRHELDEIFDSIHKHYTVIPSPEITIEANPDDISNEKVQSFKEVGVNRVSLGIQSFDDEVLKFLNRVHNSSDALTCALRLRESGINNLSIDLIHSIPNQDDRQLMVNLDKLIELAPQHISVYSLTIEPQTVFGKWASRGQLKAMDETQSANQFELVMDTLMNKGYQHYEISNFCLPGFASRHNSSYWQQKKYLGVGPSAHSFDGETRQFNVSNNHLYMNSILEGKLPIEKESLTRENKINEYIFTSLRTSNGCNLVYLINAYEYDLRKINSAYLQTLYTNNYVLLRDDSLILTRQGKLLADKIASDLFATLE